ncbi:MAG: NADH-quinone oxidoreductase subunit L [Planctomycetota bacterium]|nr:MAG: NADH-quinone oxidoreductase subunit L [Planctomycetota bacterium]
MIPDGAAMLQVLIPEIILITGAAVILMTGLGRTPGGSNAASNIAFMVLGAALWWTLTRETTDSAPSLHYDTLVHYTRVVTFGVGFLVLLSCRSVPEAQERAEFFSLLLFSLAGISLVSLANDLILLFLALELVSVPTYILIGLSRRDLRAQEATGKYFFLGAFAAAIMLYGFSFLYGGAGTTQLFAQATGETSIANYLELPSQAADKFIILGLLLSIGGLAFKLAGVPLHFYVADVYQGAASPVTGMLGFVPKFAGFLAIIRILSLTGWNFGDGLFWLLWAMASLTMIVGNTLALMQQNVKRMLAYSSVAHSGYMLVGLVAGPAALGKNTGPLSDGISALLFYMAIYAVMNLGAFAAITYFRKPGEDEEDSVETLDDLAGAGSRHPWAALCLAICVLSLMGMPPTGGFFGKLYVFSAALSAASESPRHGAMIALVVIGVLNSAVAAAYYLRIVGACYLRPASDASRRVVASPCAALKACIAVCSIFVLFVFARPSGLLSKSRSATAAPESRGVGVSTRAISAVERP